MGVRRVDELAAFQFAVELKLHVYELMDGSRSAQQDLRFRGQLFEAVSGVDHCMAEGFARFSPGEFAQFLRYALASLEETEKRLNDGIQRRYFAPESCALSFIWARRCRAATRALHASQRRRIEEEKRKRSARRSRKRDDRRT